MIQQNDGSRADSPAQPGVVYVLSIAGMAGIVKIGRVRGITLQDVRKRVGTLRSGSPYPYNIEYASKVDDAIRAERTLHQIHDASRLREHGGGSEWFAISVENGRATFELAGLELLKEVDEPDVDEIPTEPAAMDSSPATRRPPFTFDALGVPEGAELAYSPDESFACRVVSVDPPRVEYEGDNMTLGALTTRLYGSPASGLVRWKYNGKTLYSIQQGLALEQESGEEESQ